LRSYEAFCILYHLTPYPADLATLTGYLTHLANQQKKLATIHHHVASIQKRHRLGQLSSVVGTPALNEVLRAIAEKLGKKQRQAPVFTIEHLKNFIAQLDLSTTSGLRDRAVLLMGFAGAFRRSELVALNLEDFMFGDRYLLIRISRSKTLQNSAAEEKALFYAKNPLFCPITAYKQWLERLGSRLDGPLFVSIQRGSTPGTGQPSLKRLTDNSVNDLVRKHLGEFAENVPYTAQSLRASFIMASKLAGYNDDFIMNQTKHKTNSFSARYAGLAPVVKESDGYGLGL
jgi:integrase